MLIAKGLLKSQIKRAMAKRYGMAHRTTERYMARARGNMLISSNVPPEEALAESLARYNSIFRDPATSEIGRIKAQTGIHPPNRGDLRMEAPAG